MNSITIPMWLEVVAMEDVMSDEVAAEIAAIQFEIFKAAREAIANSGLAADFKLGRFDDWVVA